MSISQIELNNDLVVSINDFGDPNGFPIIVNHGLIASIKDEYFFSKLLEAGRRIICIARPGYGKTSSFMLDNIRMWGSVVNEVILKLGIEEFDVLGLSSGAPYSYGIAYELSKKTRNVFIFSGTPALFHKDVAALWPYPLNPDAEMSELQKLANELFFPNGVNKNVNSSEDSYINDCFGIALDLKIRCINWGFELSQLKANIFMEHSVDDENVPFAAAEITAKLFYNCKLKKRSIGGHFSEELLDQFIFETVLKQ
jgi:pimeloyl-ACP methyl ester carboxylesterase